MSSQPIKRKMFREVFDQELHRKVIVISDSDSSDTEWEDSGSATEEEVDYVSAPRLPKPVVKPKPIKRSRSITQEMTDQKT